MKRKRLNIIFFSVLMIAVTPKVMSNINGYADAVYQRVEAEWLNRLLSFVQAEESDNTPAAANEVTEFPLCASSGASRIQLAIVKTPEILKKKTRSVQSRNHSLDSVVLWKTSSDSNSEIENTSFDVRFDRTSRRHDRIGKALSENPIAVDRDEQSKTEYLRFLLRSINLRNSRALRVFERQIASESSKEARPFAPLPTNFDNCKIEQPETAQDATIGDAIYGTDTSTNSTF
jgi:hypothetical protein